MDEFRNRSNVTKFNFLVIFSRMKIFKIEKNVKS